MTLPLAWAGNIENFDLTPVIHIAKEKYSITSFEKPKKVTKSCFMSIGQCSLDKAN